MDTQTKRKALSRSKLNSQKRDKFTVFPIVRYNEFRQPVCQVCNVIIVEAISAHLGSPEHLEVASNLKGNATESTQNNNAKPVTDTNSSKVEPEKPLDLACKPAECLEMPKRRTPMVHPPDFLDERELQLHATEIDSDVHSCIHICVWIDICFKRH
ncbi:hypothetical protein RJT34_11515 [Clitoria ternatea]|uniref:Uncharacterized protein n=1 Tax=Clitoria ternatea TaxID=43366 RepID=A0AAN9JMN7_CLITE